MFYFPNDFTRVIPRQFQKGVAVFLPFIQKWGGGIGTFKRNVNTLST